MSASCGGSCPFLSVLLISAIPIPPSPLFIRKSRRNDTRIFLSFRKYDEERLPHTPENFISILRAAMFLIIPLDTCLIGEHIHRRLERYAVLFPIEAIFLFVPYKGAFFYTVRK